MRANFALVSELGLPRIDSEYWRELLSRGRQDHGGKEGFLDREDLWANFRNNVITKGLDNANIPEEAVSRVHAKCREMYGQLSNAIPETFRKFLEESPIGNPRTHEVEGIRVTQSSLEYTYMLSHLDPYLGSVRVLVDIGGGYGGLVRLIKLARPETRLVLLDLPEVNAIQTYFLASAFPRARVLGLSDVVALDASIRASI
jgi:putative sugar O-methyltransferase